MSDRFSIVLADDHALVRGTLARWLDSAEKLRVVAQVADADQAVVAAAEHHPDIVLLDIDMPGLAAFEAARVIRAEHPECRIVFLSAFFHDHYIDQALAVEASGYITKSESPEAVIEGLLSVATGAAYFSPEVRARIVVESEGTRLAGHPVSRAASLTPREVEVLRYLARGMAKKEIARTMHVSTSTVSSHVEHLMEKLDIHDRVELARFAIREGLAEA